MATIPDASDLGSRPIPRRARGLVSDQSGEILADAGARFGATVSNVAGQITQRDDSFRYAQAKSALLQADIEARKSLDNDTDWENYETKYQSAMNKALEGASKQMRSRRDQSLFGMDAKLDMERGLQEIRTKAKAKEVDWGRSTLSSTLDANRSAALSAADEMTRTAFVKSSQDAIQGALSKGYVNAQEAENQRQRWTESYAGGYIDTLPYSKQVDVLKKPQGTPAQFLQPDTRANLLRQAENSLRLERDRAEAEQRSKMIEVRQSLTDQLRDITVGAQMGLPVSVPSKAVLQAAFGEREGAQRYDLAVKASKLSGDVASLQQLPTDKLIERVDSYKPTQTEGAADQAQLYGMVSKSASDIIKQRQEDPAGYLAQFAPRTQAAWQAFQRDDSPQARDAYLSAVEADRERLQLPKGDVLPNSYAKELAEEIANPKSAESLASLMEQEAQRWGDRWPDVHAQIAKDLPDIAAVIGSGVDRSAAVTLASTAGLKDKELQAMLPPSVKWGDVQADVASTFDDVRRSFPAEGARTWQAIHDSAVRLSVSYMQAGASKGNAIDRAYKELIGNQYDVGTVKDVPFLVPRQFDPGDVEDEAERLLNEFQPSVDMIAAPAGEDAARFLERATKKFRDDSYWVARGDGQGLRLYMGARPTPISYDFRQLADMAQARRANDQATVKRLREQALKARSTN